MVVSISTAMHSEFLGVGTELSHALLVIGCVFLGWRASGVLLRSLGAEKNQKAKEGSDCFRSEVASFAQEHSVEAAMKHSGLSSAEVKQCQSEFFSLQTFFSWWGPGKAVASVTEDHDEDGAEDDFTEQVAWSSSETGHAGLHLLEHYGVFGACRGSWSGPLAC